MLTEQIIKIKLYEVLKLMLAIFEEEVHLYIVFLELQKHGYFYKC